MLARSAAEKLTGGPAREEEAISAIRVDRAWRPRLRRLTTSTATTGALAARSGGTTATRDGAAATRASAGRATAPARRPAATRATAAPARRPTATRATTSAARRTTAPRSRGAARIATCAEPRVLTDAGRVTSADARREYDPGTQERETGARATSVMWIQMSRLRRRFDGTNAMSDGLRHHVDFREHE